MRPWSGRLQRLQQVVVKKRTVKKRKASSPDQTGRRLEGVHKERKGSLFIGGSFQSPCRRNDCLSLNARLVYEPNARLADQRQPIALI